MKLRSRWLLPAAFVALLAWPGAASATYPGANGVFVWQAFESIVSPTGTAISEYNGLDSTAGALPSLACASTPGSDYPLQCDYGGPTFSPNGQGLAVSQQIPLSPTNGVGGTGAIEYAFQGQAPQEINQMTIDDEHPAILPSGREIIFDGRLANSRARNLYEVDLGGNGLQLLTRTGGAEPAPCANGTVAFSRASGLWLLSASHTTVHEITANGNEPSCAPNSHRIAFIRHNQVYTIRTDGTHLRRVSPMMGYAPQYAPDGSEIAFLHVTTDPGGYSNTEIVVVSATGRLEPALGVRSVAFSAPVGNSGDRFVGRSAGFAWQQRVG